MKNMMMIAAIAVAAVFTPAQAKDSTAQIKQRIIQESIASYPGNCPCPYNSASNGSRCGKRSAYKRRGGYSPMCYASDVSDAEVASYRRRNGK